MKDLTSNIVLFNEQDGKLYVWKTSKVPSLKMNDVAEQRKSQYFVNWKTVLWIIFTECFAKFSKRKQNFHLLFMWVAEPFSLDNNIIQSKDKDTVTRRRHKC